MPTDVKLILRIVAYVVAIIIAWWFLDELVDWIRAPVQAKLDKAVTANASLKGSNDALTEANKRLNETMRKRGVREDGIDRKLDDIKQGLKQKKEQDPAVNDWAKTRIPDKVLQ